MSFDRSKTGFLNANEMMEIELSVRVTEVSSDPAAPHNVLTKPVGSISVYGINDAPVAVPDAYKVIRGQSLDATKPKAGILDNDSDPDSVTDIQLISIGLNDNPVNFDNRQSVEVVGIYGHLISYKDGHFIYTSNPNVPVGGNPWQSYTEIFNYGEFKDEVQL